MATSKMKTGTAGGDWIHLRRVKTHCVLGVHPAERGKERPVWMDISLECDVRRAARSDQLADTLEAIDFHKGRAPEVVAAAKRGRFRLVEALAESVAAVCLAHPRVLAARVVVEKPKALPLTQSVAVEILRRR